MKKAINTLAILLVAMFSSILFAACGNAEPIKIEVKKDSIATTILANSSFDTSKLVLVVTYDNNKTKEVAKNDEMELSAIDTSKIGQQELTVKYLNLTAVIKINVVAHKDDLYKIVGFEKPDFQVSFEEESVKYIPEGETTGEFDESEDCFKVTGRTYKVGDDNPFVYIPKIKARNDKKEVVTLTSYTSNVKVEMFGSSDFIELTGDNLKEMVAVDNTKSTFDFTEKAIGKIFKITVEPIAEKTSLIKPISFACEIVNGWNIQTKADLSRLDNAPGTQAYWKDYKTAHNIGNEEFKAAVLHNNFTITRNDIPQSFIYKEGDAETTAELKGSLKNRKSIYTRYVAYDDTFHLWGNYFTIKTKNRVSDKDTDFIPLVKASEWEANGFSHSGLFSFGADNDGHPAEAQGTSYVHDLKLFGNGSRSAEGTENGGGLNAFFTNGRNLQLDNCNVRAFVIHVVTMENRNHLENGISKMSEYNCHILDSKLYDTFSMMYCAWGSKHNIIENSIMKRSGGPLVMGMHVPNNGKFDDSYYADITVKNSELESKVQGTEPWFGVYNATPVATYLRILGELFTKEAAKYGIPTKSYVNNDGHFSFISGTFASNNPVLNQDLIKGTVSFSDADGKLISAQELREDQNLMKIINNEGGILPEGVDTAVKQMPIYKCNNVYITLDVSGEITETVEVPLGGDKKLVMPVYDSFAILDYNASAPGTGFRPFKTISDQDPLKIKMREFFAADYAHFYLNGGALGATFNMYKTTAR